MAGVASWPEGWQLSRPAVLEGVGDGVGRSVPPLGGTVFAQGHTGVAALANGQAAPSSPAVAERPSEHLWERMEFPSIPGRWGWWQWREEGLQAQTPTQATHSCLHTHTHTHTHPGGPETLCWNQEREENKELYTTKDMTSIFFQVDFSLPWGWQLKEERERERVG